MKVGPGMAAFITGAGSGLGRALALELAKKGVHISVAELSEVNGLETVRLLEKVNAERQQPLTKPAAIFIKCDVANPGQVAAAFLRHMQCFGRLDICINNAGLGEIVPFTKDNSTDGSGAWRHIVNVNLIAVIDCTRLAIQAMKGGMHGGVILNIGSAAGLYPNYDGPIYSATKGGVVLFTRSLRLYAKEKIRINVICPEFLETDMAKGLEKAVKELGGFIPMEKFIQGAFELLEDESKAGACLWITNRRGFEYWPTSEEMKKYQLKRSSSRKKPSYGPPQTSIITVPEVPGTFRKLVVHSLNSNFRVATKIVSVTFKPPVKAGHVLVKYLFSGVNASDVNYSAGRYFGGKKEATSQLPFDAGFEAVGIVTALGEGITESSLPLGSSVATIAYGGFAEFAQIPATYAIPVPVATPEVVAMLTSGLTAYLGLEQGGWMRSGETVLVTAAAGGTGQFAVQLAKIAGNKVVATCGGTEKAMLLRNLGVDRVIDYHKESVAAVLKKEYPNGIDLVYESVGGEMFQTCMSSLAKFGRLVIIGMISQYKGENDWKISNHPGLCEKLLWKSQSVAGFFLLHYAKQWNEAFRKLYKLYVDGLLKVKVDPTPFYGLLSVADAVEYLHSGQSIGKVVVRIDPQSRM